jgi:hypothetical protein
MKVILESIKKLPIFGSRLPSASQLLLIVWRQYLEHFTEYMRISLLSLIAFPFVLPGILILVTGISSTGSALTDGTGEGWLSLLLAGAGTAATAFTAALVRPALIATVYMSLIGRRLKPHDALRRSFDVFWRYVVALVAVGVLTAAGFGLLFVPGVVVLIYFLLTEQSIVLEDEGVVASFKRSVELVRGRFWAVLWRVAFVGGIFLLAAFCLAIVLTQIPLAALSGFATTPAAARWLMTPFLLISALLSAATLPLFSTLQTVLFAELRKLKKVR